MNKYEILYKKGLISYEEYQEKSAKLALDVQFEDKLNKELNQFKKSLKRKSKKEIMNRSYELTCKEEIKHELLNLDDSKKILVILFLEGDFGCQTRTKRTIMKSLQDSMNTKLQWLKCQVSVVDSDTYNHSLFEVS